MVAGIVQSDLKIIEINIEKIACGKRCIWSLLDLRMFEKFLIVACRLEDVFEYPYKSKVSSPNSPKDDPL